MKISATTTTLLLLCCMATIFGSGTAIRDMPENGQQPQQQRFNRYGTHMPENVRPQQPEMLNPQGTHMPAETVQPGNLFQVDLRENVQEKLPEMYHYHPHYPYHPRHPPYYYIPPQFPPKCVSALYEVPECVEDIIKSLRAGIYGPSKVCCKVLTDINEGCPHSDQNKFLHAATLHHCPNKHHSNHP